MLQKYSVLLVCLLFLFGACRKEETISVSFEVLSVNENINIHKIIFLSDSVGFACGGRQFDYGAIFKTTNNGNNWKKVYSSNLRSVYNLHFVDDSKGYAGGDSMLLLTTNDRGENWNEFWFDTIPRDKYQRTAFKNFFFFNENEFLMVGGQNYDSGLIYKTTDAGNNWIFKTFENELKGIYFIDELNGYLSGYGVIYKTNDGGLSYQLCSIKGDFFTSVYFGDKDNGVAVGYNGGIYKTQNAGNNWKTIVKPNKAFEKRTHFNDIKFGDTNIGYAVGSDGLLMITEDGGNNWKLAKKFCDDNLFSITILTNKLLLITSEKGKIYKVSL